MKRKAMNLPESSTITMEDVRKVSEQFKEDLTRECERFVRRGDNQSALAAIVGKEYIDKFLYALELRAGSQLDSLKRPARARDIHIPENLGKKKGPSRNPAE